MLLADLLEQPPWEVAPALLGATIRNVTDGGAVAVVLSEVEAYAGEDDPASHAWRGRTPRNSTMYGRAGLGYVYRTRQHLAINVVTGTEGRAAAVLLRAGRVTEGVDVARARRGTHLASERLARGPANLARALGLRHGDDGTDLLADGGLTLTLGEPVHEPVVVGPRVGVTRAHDVPWRFHRAGDPTVSAYRRAPTVG